ncbi:hypothetical protein KAR91_07780 [Candidatus Pacearchaeota archaeon]|nr:hypothetical protein [Candidatus Pacearchaeota archaeon]
MIRTKQAKRVLGKKEQKHLTEMGINSLAQFKINREKQLKQKAEAPDIEPCWDCRMIASKLGVV